MKYNFRELVSDSRTGLNPRKNFVLGNGSNYYITIKDIHDGKIVITDKTDRVDDDAIAIIKRRSRIKNGDVLFTSIGRVGETAIVTNKDDSWDVNESVFVFTLNAEVIIAAYFCLLFQSQSVRDSLIKDSTGSTFKSIKMSQLERMSFEIPSIEAQKYIVGKIKKNNSVIEMRKQQFSKFDTLLKARFVEMFGDPVNNPMNWKKERLQNHIEMITGYPFDSSGYSENGIKICGGLIIMPGGIKWGECKHWPSMDGYEQFLLEPEDIVVALDRPWISEGFKVGMVNRKDLPVLLIQRTARIRGVDMEQNFLLHLLKDKAFECQCMITGSLVPHISNRDINNYEVILPPLELQQQFAAFVAQTDKSKFDITVTIEFPTKEVPNHDQLRLFKISSTISNLRGCRHICGANRTYRPGGVYYQLPQVNGVRD